MTYYQMSALYLTAIRLVATADGGIVCVALTARDRFVVFVSMDIMLEVGARGSVPSGCQPHRWAVRYSERPVKSSTPDPAVG